MAQLPDNFAELVGGEDRRILLKGLVLRQQLSRLAMKGLNATRAAQLVGCSKETARAVYRDPDFRREVVSRVDGAFVDIDAAFVDSRKSMHERLSERAEKAFDQLCELLDDNSTLPSIRVKIAQDFMDRNPETQAGHTVTKLSPALQSEQLAHAAKIAREVDGAVGGGGKITPIRRVG